MKRTIRIGVGGPVGSGKTMIIERLTRHMADDYNIAVITNDIYTKEDAEFMVKNSVLSEDRIIGVETGAKRQSVKRQSVMSEVRRHQEIRA